MSQPYKKTHVLHKKPENFQAPQTVAFQATFQPVGVPGLIVSPAPGAVTADILTQMEAGIPPTNDQLSDVIDTTTGFLEQKQREPTLSSKTRKTVADVSTVLKDTKRFLEEKNQDETLQTLFVQGKVAAESMAVKAGSGTTGEMMDIAGNLVRVMVKSSEFRNLLMSLVELLETVTFVTEKKAKEQQYHGLSGQEVESEGSPSTRSESTSYTRVYLPPAYADTTSSGSSSPRSYEPAPVIPTTTGFIPAPQAMTMSTTSSTTSNSFAREVFQRYSGSGSTLRDTSSFTEDEKRKVRSKLSKVLINFSSHDEYRLGLEALIHLGGLLKKEVNDLIYNRSLSTDPLMLQMLSEAKTFLQRFSGDYTIDKLLSETRSFLKLIMDDPLLNRYFDEFSDFFLQLVERPHAIVDESSFVRRLDEMINRGLNLLSGIQQHSHLSNIIKEAKGILSSVRDDPVRRKLATDMKVLASDFVTYGKDGKPVLNTNLVSQLKTLMVPLLSEHLREVPIPKIIASNDTYDYWIDNMTFSAEDLLPDQFHVHVDSDADINLATLSTQKSVTRMVLTARGIRTTMRDIQFWFKRKSFPKTEDEGFATVEMNGDKGASILIQLTFCPERNLPFDVHAVRFNIDELDISISETKHDWLYNMFTSFYKSSIKEKVEQEVQRKLRAIIFKMNHQMNLLFCDAKQGIAEFATNAFVAGGKVISGTGTSSGISESTNLLSR